MTMESLSSFQCFAHKMDGSVMCVGTSAKQDAQKQEATQVCFVVFRESVHNALGKQTKTPKKSTQIPIVQHCGRLGAVCQVRCPPRCELKFPCPKKNMQSFKVWGFGFYVAFF